MTVYLTNAWAWNMPHAKKGSVDYRDLSEDEFLKESKGAISCIGNPILAHILKLPYNPSYIDLDEGDVAIVIGLKGGRLPVGTTEFPDDVSVKYTRVEIKEATA